MEERVTKEVIAKVKELWVKLHSKPYKTYGTDAYGLPIIYLDTVGNVDWCEKGFEDYWVDAQLIFKFPYTIAESEIEHTIRQKFFKHEKENENENEE